MSDNRVACEIVLGPRCCAHTRPATSPARILRLPAIPSRLIVARCFPRRGADATTLNARRSGLSLFGVQPRNVTPREHSHTPRSRHNGLVLSVLRKGTIKSKPTAIYSAHGFFAALRSQLIRFARPGVGQASGTKLIHLCGRRAWAP